MAIFQTTISGLNPSRLRPAQMLGSACAYAAFALSIAFTGAIVFGIVG